MGPALLKQFLSFVCCCLAKKREKCDGDALALGQGTFRLSKKIQRQLSDSDYEDTSGTGSKTDLCKTLGDKKSSTLPRVDQADGGSGAEFSPRTKPEFRRHGFDEYNTKIAILKKPECPNYGSTISLQGRSRFEESLVKTKSSSSRSIPNISTNLGIATFCRERGIIRQLCNAFLACKVCFTSF